MSLPFWGDQRLAKTETQEDATTHLLYWAILLASVIYGCLFLYKTSFLIHGQRFFVLFDDAMVAMRYARNLADGHGLVWNPGEPAVEGYTNPLWMLYMALWHLAPLSASKASLPIQLTGILILVANLTVIFRITSTLTRSALARLSAVFLTAFYYPLINWTIQGMEVGLVALVTSMAAYLSILTVQDSRFRSSIYWWLTAGLLVRLDFFVIALVISAFLLLYDRGSRKRHVIHIVVFLLGNLVLQTGVRYWYFGELLPNTYYLKMTGYPLIGRVTDGAGWFLKFVWAINPAVLAAAVWALVADRRKPLQLLFGLVAAMSAYSIWVGADAWDHHGPYNRYLTTIMPLLFVLVAASVVSFLFSAEDEPPRRTAPVRLAVATALLLLLLLSLRGHPLPFTVGRLAWGVGLALLCFLLTLGVFRKLRPPVLLPYLPVVAGLLLALSFANFNWSYPRPLRTWFLLTPPLHTRDHPNLVRKGLLAKSITGPDSRIAVAWAGIIPYFADRSAVDFLGKNDAVIAREPANPVMKEFWPGHMKWDYRYSIGQLRPDVILQTWPSDLPVRLLPEAAQAMGNAYVEIKTELGRIYIRRDSTKLKLADKQPTS